MSNTHPIIYTDTVEGDPNFAWERRDTIIMPELTHYGYTGSTDGSYAKALKPYNRELMRCAKAAMGITGLRGVTSRTNNLIEFRPYRCNTVLIIEDAE